MAGPLEDGEAAYQRGDYATALQIWRPLADQGDAGAQAWLGLMYDNGHGVTQDYAEAARWYRLAAAQGLALAQFNLGEMYYLGQGVPQDYAEAVKWYRLEAVQGNATAQYNLGAMYSLGQGVPRTTRKRSSGFDSPQRREMRMRKPVSAWRITKGKASRRTMFARTCGSILAVRRVVSPE